MRPFHLLIALALATVALPLAAADEPTFACHDWEIFHGDPAGTGVGVSTDDGAVYAGHRLDEPVLGEEAVYVVSDGTAPAVSVWAYTEENSEPGLQRADRPCDESEFEAHDCFLSCTF